MERKRAFLIALMFTILIAGNYLIFSYNPPQRELVTVARVIDGDTLVLEDGRTIRLLNINSPEKSTPFYTLSLNYLKPLENNSIELEVTGVDKYSRTLARIYNPEYVNLNLVLDGLATKFLVHSSEIKDFAEAEKYAIENSFGIWEHSQYYGCFTAEIDAEDEKITLINACGPLNLKDWIISDESSKTYKFYSINLNKITLHSEIGEDNEDQIYWNSKRNIWNNDRDTFYLFDSEGKIAHHQAYGY